MKLAVILLNLGGPRNLKEVRPFLYRLFSDPDIIPLPTIFQKPLAYFISVFRLNLSKSYYRKIGGGSPLTKITGQQAAALQKSLSDKYDDVKVYVAMRYWHPLTDVVWAQIKKDARTHLVVLPLYPQYSIATTGSSFRVLQELVDHEGEKPNIQWIKNWHDHPLYLKAFVQKIKDSINLLPAVFRNDYDLIFSAHSLPMKFVKQGDPYEQQTKETVHKILDQLENVPSWHLSYQSKTGPIPWLGPSTTNLLKDLSTRRKRAILMVPISFVSDHVETLYEMDILYKEQAEALGFPHFSRVRALNLSEPFIEALQDIVVRHVEKM